MILRCFKDGFRKEGMISLSFDIPSTLYFLRGQSCLCETFIRPSFRRMCYGEETRRHAGDNRDHHIQLSKVSPGFEKYTHRQGNGM